MTEAPGEFVSAITRLRDLWGARRAESQERMLILNLNLDLACFGRPARLV